MQTKLRRPNSFRTILGQEDQLNVRLSDDRAYQIEGDYPVCTWIAFEVADYCQSSIHLLAMYLLFGAAPLGDAT